MSARIAGAATVGWLLDRSQRKIRTYTQKRIVLFVTIFGTVWAMNYKQSRAARGLLGWSQQTLADAANVSLATIQLFETNKRDPIPNNLTAIRHALEEAGVDFIPAKSGKGIGVRLREGSEFDHTKLE
jgi:DNA-binding XRE family transcriptional regulator